MALEDKMEQRQKIRDYGNTLLRWAIGNTAWDIFKRLLSLIPSAYFTWKLSIQPTVSDWLVKMNIPIIISIVVMFLGFLVIVWAISSLLAWVIRWVNRRLFPTKYGDDKEFIKEDARNENPKIKFKRVIEEDLQYNHDRACLIVESNEPTRLICSAKLIQADYLFSMGNVLYVHPQKLDTLEWMSQNQGEAKNCENIIAPHDNTRKILVAQNINGIVFTYCRGPRKSIGHGIVLITVRLDGIDENNKSIQPCFFHGYIHIFNVVAGRYNFPTLQIGEGDWTKDEKIPIEVRTQRVQK